MADSVKNKVYGPFTFADGYSKSLAEFKKEFGNAEFFRMMHPKKREAEIKKAHKIATNGNAKTSPDKSKKSNASKGNG